MNTIDYGEDPLAVEQQQNQRRLQLAQMIAQQGLAPSPVFSNKAAIAKALTGVLGQMDMGRAEQQERALAERRDAGRQQEMDTLFQFMNQQGPTQGKGMPQVDDEGNPMPGNIDQTAAKRMELARTMLGSRNPVLQQAALSAMSPKQEEAYTLAEGAQRYQGGKLVASNMKPKEAEKEPDSVRALRAELKAAGIDPESDMGKQIFMKAAEKSTTHQPAASMTVNTGKKFGETLATNVAEQVAQSADSARGAVDTLNTAKQIDTALASGKVMAGPGTSGLMFIQQAIGAPSTEEGRVKTREVIQGLSQMTLAARKQLKGQGQISDFEGKLLAKAASGDIDSLTIPEIKALTATATRLANGAIVQHQSYLKKIQSDPELKGLAPFFDVNPPSSQLSPEGQQMLEKYR